MFHNQQLLHGCLEALRMYPDELEFHIALIRLHLAARSADQAVSTCKQTLEVIPRAMENSEFLLEVARAVSSTARDTVAAIRLRSMVERFLGTRFDESRKLDPLVCEAIALIGSTNHTQVIRLNRCEADLSSSLTEDISPTLRLRILYTLLAMYQCCKNTFTLSGSLRDLLSKDLALPCPNGEVCGKVFSELWKTKGSSASLFASIEMFMYNMYLN